MLATQIPKINHDEFSWCEETEQKIDRGKSLSPSQKTDASIKGLVDRAIWNDDVLRAIEYDEIAVHVRNGVVYLSGHIVSTTSQSRIKNAIRVVPNILGIQNNLVLDDKLTLEVASSLGKLEHTYGCKFSTGASHGVITLSGIVGDENVKIWAETFVASNPNVRAVINNVRISGSELELPEEPFRQPSIGETIYFLDRVSGVVKQVIINPNNRRVVAMNVWGQFADQRQDLKSIINRGAGSPERLVVLSMDVVRFMTKVSGFLHINSNERKRYMDFDPTRFSTPENGWKAPYPYCPDDVLFPIEKRDVEYQILEQLPRPPSVVAMQEQALWEQLLADESLGG
jgi:osmotically-inducible protein OsmY